MQIVPSLLLSLFDRRAGRRSVKVRRPRGTNYLETQCGTAFSFSAVSFDSKQLMATSPRGTKLETRWHNNKKSGILSLGASRGLKHGHRRGRGSHSPTQGVAVAFSGSSLSQDGRIERGQRSAKRKRQEASGLQSKVARANCVG